MKTSLIKPLSIKQYALLFTLTIVLLITGVGVFTQSGLKNLKSDIHVSSLGAAEWEMKQAVEDVAAEIQLHTHEYTQWEEVSQQIGDPLFYAYWKKYRSLTAGNLPEYVLDTALYDNMGAVLGKLDTSRLPDSISPSSIESYFDIRNSKLEIVTIEPIRAASDDGTTIGYVAMRSDMRPSLIEMRQFNNVEHKTITLRGGIHEHLSISALPEYISFKLRSNPILEDTVHIVTNMVILMATATIILTLLFYPIVTYLIAKPLTQISRHIDRLKESSMPLVLQRFRSRLPVTELEKVRNSLNEYHFQLHEVHDNLDESNKKLWHLAHHDALTGTRNRRAFDEYLKSLNELYLDTHFEICLAIFDVDNFKAINDTYGHQVGDEVIKTIAQSISSVLREGDHLYRLGGDEFATVFVNHDSGTAVKVAERCQQAVSNYPFHKLGIKEPVRISIGISTACTPKQEQLSDIQSQADIAMYSVKQRVNSNIAVFSEEMRAGARGMFSSRIHNAVYEAISDGIGLEIFYQPILDLKNGKIAYYEALLRIVRDNKIIMPIDIFRFVETKGLEQEMDFAILEKIYNDLKNGVVPQGTGVSINISGPSIVQTEIVERLAGFMEFSDHYKLVLEITETALITQIEEASKNLDLLQSMGFLTALDDFGSGYSSISYLANMPIDIVKFDISLIRCLDIKRQRAIVEHLAKMIIDTGYQLVAEGIETDKTKDDVAEMGFNFGQGYLFGKPESMSGYEQQEIKQVG